MLLACKQIDQISLFKMLRVCSTGEPEDKISSTVTLPVSAGTQKTVRSSVILSSCLCLVKAYELKL